jgi:hypothetical protein
LAAVHRRFDPCTAHLPIEVMARLTPSHGDFDRVLVSIRALTADAGIAGIGG